MIQKLLKLKDVFLIGLLLVGIPTSTYARDKLTSSSLDDFPAVNKMHQWYLAFEAGSMHIEKRRSSMTVLNGSDDPPPTNMDQYSLNRPRPTVLGIQIGHRWYREGEWLPSYVLALRYQHVLTKNITGEVIQYSDPEFANYRYTWDISTDVLSLYGKLDLVQIRCVMIYIDFGIGTSFNQSNTYHETAFPNVIPRSSPNYASKLNTQLAYNVGVGLEYSLTQNLIISASYSYQKFGELSSGYGEGPDWGEAQIKLGQLNSKMGLIAIAYLFN